MWKPIYTLAAGLLILCSNVVRAQECTFGSPEAFDALAKSLAKQPSCQAAAKEMHDCMWGSSADTELAPIAISKCESTFFAKLSDHGKKHYEDEMQLCAYEYAKAQGTISMSAAALCQLDVATKFASNPGIAEQPIPHASFDCGRAVSPLEKAICSDVRLGNADITLGRVYDRFLLSMHGTSRGDLIQSEKGWLNRIVSDCSASREPLSLATENCVRSEFENRFTDLDTCWDSPEEQSPSQCLREMAEDRRKSDTSDVSKSARASFDCERPNSSLQLAICADAELGQKDIALSKEVTDLMSDANLGRREQLEASQRNWLKYVQGVCPLGTVGGIPPVLTRSCIRTAFETRIMQLPECEAKDGEEGQRCLNTFKLFADK